MGSTGESIGVVDGGPGLIVWVRRRNGSWWPGKILGPEDMAASHLMSPRSGTPVKLLGREDASVDWYNLEKSKRVKAFRCGEFDDCIEKAEASVGLPVKKREKYARREDAILHALELEKQYLQKSGKLVKPHHMKEASSEPESKMLATTPSALENGNGLLGNHVLCQADRKVDVATTLGSNGIPPHAPKVLDCSHPKLEEHSIGMSSHIRELSDSKLKALPMSKMFYSAASEDPKGTAIDGHGYAITGSCPGFENSDSDSRNFKGKRLLESCVEESVLKRHRGQHSFVNIMQNSVEFPDCSLRPELYMKGLSGDGAHCHFMYMPTESPEMFDANPHPQDQMEMPVSRLEAGTQRSQHDTFAEQTPVGSSEETESDSSETHSLEPRVEPGMLLSDAETRILAQPRFGRIDMQPAQESTSSDESDELRSQFHFVDPSPSGSGVSKWQLKGKRNVRSMNKRPMDKMTQRTYLDEKGRPLNQRARSHCQSYYHDNGYTNDPDFIEDDFDPHINGFGKRGCMQPQAASRRQGYVGQNMIDWEELTWGRPFRGYWEDLGGCFNSMYVRNGHDMLIDVDLKVQANRQGQHVPWVSLMSKLNGKAIIGHPIQIETLEDGATDIVLTTSDESVYDSDRGQVPSMWRTARRTANFRVPRPHQSSQLDGDENSDRQHLHPSARVRSKKPIGSISVRKGSLLKKTHAHVSRSPLGIKKPPKEGALSSNQKTKPLSLIGFDQKFASQTRDNDTSYCMDTVIKPVNSGPQTVACIPVKLVFSRLLEAVGRPPSGPAKHGVSVNSK